MALASEVIVDGSAYDIGTSGSTGTMLLKYVTRHGIEVVGFGLRATEALAVGDSTTDAVVKLQHVAQDDSTVTDKWVETFTDTEVAKLDTIGDEIYKDLMDSGNAFYCAPGESFRVQCTVVMDGTTGTGTVVPFVVYRYVPQAADGVQVTTLVEMGGAAS